MTEGGTVNLLEIEMKYLNKKFSSKASTDDYRCGWDRVFGQDDPAEHRVCFECGAAYRGKINCPECGEAAGEPIGGEDG